MAKLYIREYAAMAQVQASKADIAAPQEPGVDQPALTLGAAQQSAAFAETTRFIGVTADGIFSYSVGVNPTATVDMMRIPAGQLIFMGVKPGHKISVVTNT